MKMIQVIPITLIFASVFALQGFTSTNPRNLNKTLRDKVVRFLDRPDLSELEGEKFRTEIEFIVNRQNQLVVLAVYTDSAFLDTYIKEKLNYKEIKLKGVPCLTPYRIEVNFLQPDDILRKPEVKVKAADKLMTEVQIFQTVTPQRSVC